MPQRSGGEGVELESLADEALTVMEDRSILTPLRRKWLAGAISRSQVLKLPICQLIQPSALPRSSPCSLLTTRRCATPSVMPLPA